MTSLAVLEVDNQEVTFSTNGVDDIAPLSFAPHAYSRYIKRSGAHTLKPEILDNNQANTKEWLEYLSIRKEAQTPETAVLVPMEYGFVLAYIKEILVYGKTKPCFIAVTYMEDAYLEKSQFEVVISIKEGLYKKANFLQKKESKIRSRKLDTYKFDT